MVVVRVVRVVRVVGVVVGVVGVVGVEGVVVVVVRVEGRVEIEDARNDLFKSFLFLNRRINDMLN